MGNLYEHTLSMQYIKDMVLLESEKESNDGKSLQEKLSKYPKYVSQIDDKAQAIIPKISKSRQKEIDKMMAELLKKQKTDN